MCMTTYMNLFLLYMVVQHSCPSNQSTCNMHHHKVIHLHHVVHYHGTSVCAELIQIPVEVIVNYHAIFRGVLYSSHCQFDPIFTQMQLGNTCNVSHLRCIGFSLSFDLVLILWSHLLLMLCVCGSKRSVCAVRLIGDSCCMRIL